MLYSRLQELELCHIEGKIHSGIIFLYNWSRRNL